MNTTSIISNISYSLAMVRLLKVSVFLIITLFFLSAITDEPKTPFSPTALSTDGKTLFVAGKTAQAIEAYNLESGELQWSFKTNLPTTGIALSKQYLWATQSLSEGELLKIDLKKQSAKHIKVGHGACAPILDPVRSLIYIANQYNNDVSIVDRKKLKELKRIQVQRQPMAQDIRPDGQYLFVANLLPSGRADKDTVAASVSVIDLDCQKLVKHIQLANGSNALRGIKVSPDGKFVFVSHNLGRFQVPTTQLEQGWMNTSALSIIDAQRLEYVATILLDEPTKGAAGSWGIDINEKYLFVAHSGTHDFSRIDYKAFVEKLAQCDDKESLSYNLKFLYGIRQRFLTDGNGPRAIRYTNDKLVVANYFSDELKIFPVEQPEQTALSIELNTGYKPNIVRKGEMYFNDASYCFQQWQSCNGCHPNDARVDGLNWDLLNDGTGNQKNCKSMLNSHVTAPAMITGIRASAEVAVRAGFKHIQFSQVDEERTRAVDEYLKSLKAVASPHLIKGNLSPKALVGKKVFEKVGCGYCHNGTYFTDQQKHTMGKQGQYDHQNSWDTPSLIEVWRTGPYLHDGRCANLKDVFSQEKHGLKHHELSENDIEALEAYVLSL